VVGGVYSSGNAHFSTTPVTGAASVADPLASLPVPSVAGSSRGAVDVTGDESLTIDPGVYSRITVSGNGALTFNPGIYVIAGGGLTASGNAIINGSGVMIYNAGSNYSSSGGTGGTSGSVSLSGNAHANLTAPTSGDYAGIVLFQARDNTRALFLSGNAIAGVNGGAIYASNAQLGISGNGHVTKAPLVVGSLVITGNSGAFQLADGASSDFVSSTANQILYGALTVSVQDDVGDGPGAEEIGRIDEAMSYLNAALGTFGVTLTWAAPGADADVHIHIAATTPHGGASDGVLGFTTSTNDVYLVTGWNYYKGTDPGQIGADQYDFQTLAIHELGHTVGLGESADPDSVMYEYLAPGTVRRTFTDSNLTLINSDADRFMKVDAPAPAEKPLPADTAARQGPAVPVPMPADLGTAGGPGSDRGSGGLPFTGQEQATPMAPIDAGTNGNFAPTAFLVGQGDRAGRGAAGTAGKGRPDSIMDDNRTAPGGPGQDVLVGGHGNDMLIGGDGRDVLVGGFGSDDLHADACWTSSHVVMKQQALMGAMREWTGPYSFASHLNDMPYGTGHTFFDDQDDDTLAGDSGADAFWINLDIDDPSSLFDASAGPEEWGGEE
jgi:hypothetical protein